MSESNRTPDQVAQGTPGDLMSRGERAVFTGLGELREDVKSVKADGLRDFRLTWTGLIAGFLILAGLFLYGYNRLEDRMIQLSDKLEGKASDLQTGEVRIETKLDDLSRQILPPPAPARNLR